MNFICSRAFPRASDFCYFSLRAYYMHSTRASTPTRPDHLPKPACPSICSNLSADKPRSSLERGRCGSWKKRCFRQPKNLCVCDCKVKHCPVDQMQPVTLSMLYSNYSLQGKVEETILLLHMCVPSGPAVFLSYPSASAANYHRRSRCRSPTHLHIPRRSQRVHRKVPRAHQCQ